MGSNAGWLWGLAAIGGLYFYGTAIPTPDAAPDQTPTEMDMLASGSVAPAAPLALPARPGPLTGYAPLPSYTSPTFMSYSCLENCEGHEAGYKWAEEQGITDELECGGNSESFREGCMAYAEEQQYDFTDAAGEDYGDW